MSEHLNIWIPSYKQLRFKIFSINFIIVCLNIIEITILKPKKGLFLKFFILKTWFSLTTSTVFNDNIQLYLFWMEEKNYSFVLKILFSYFYKHKPLCHPCLVLSCQFSLFSVSRWDLQNPQYTEPELLSTCCLSLHYYKLREVVI